MCIRDRVQTISTEFPAGDNIECFVLVVDTLAASSSSTNNISVINNDDVNLQQYFEDILLNYPVNLNLVDKDEMDINSAANINKVRSSISATASLMNLRVNSSYTNRVIGQENSKKLRSDMIRMLYNLSSYDERSVGNIKSRLNSINIVSNSDELDNNAFGLSLDLLQNSANDINMIWTLNFFIYINISFLTSNNM